MAKLLAQSPRWDTEAFGEKYNVFLKERDTRRAKQSELLFTCDICGKGTKTESGMKQHKSKNGCLKHTAESKKIKNQYSPVKAVAKSYDAEQDEDEDEGYGLL